MIAGFWLMEPRFNVQGASQGVKAKGQLVTAMFRNETQKTFVILSAVSCYGQ